MSQELYLRLALACLTAAIYVDRHVIHGRAPSGDAKKTGSGLVEFFVQLTAGLWALSLVLYIVNLDAFSGVVALPLALRIIGVAIMALSGVLSHIVLRSLGRQLSKRLDASGHQMLVQEGPYSFVRHPIYAVLFLCATGTCLITSSLVVIAATASVVPVFLLRIRHEESLLIERFGDEYREYRRTTGALAPKFATIFG